MQRRPKFSRFKKARTDIGIPPILAIGSVHLDIVADIEPTTGHNLDKIGRLRYAIGGTAFNLAANLAYHGIPILLFSVIRKKSFSATLIGKELAKRGISSSYVRGDPTIAESAFLAHTQDGVLVTAVSCLGIQDARLPAGELEEAIRRCSLVAMDCNLARAQIQQILKISKRLRKPICVSAVSESKVHRIFRTINTGGKPAFRVVLLNELEMNNAIGAATPDPTGICDDFSAEYVIVTRGREGFSVLSKQANSIDYPSPISDVVSTLGAGDATFAAICAHLRSLPSLDQGDIFAEVQKYLAPVLCTKLAVPEPRRSLRPLGRRSSKATRRRGNKGGQA